MQCTPTQVFLTSDLLDSCQVQVGRSYGGITWGHETLWTNKNNDSMSSPMGATKLIKGQADINLAQSVHAHTVLRKSNVWQK